MPTDRNAIVTFQPSQDLTLASSLMGIEGALAAAAHRNVATQLGDTADYTQMEMRSMETIEELKLVNGMDLAAILLRGQLLRRIEDEALWTFHPNQYTTLEAMAREQGISVSELSNVRDLCFVIFPYMEQTLGLNVAQTFENIGKSNMRELVPVLKAVITGEIARGSVQASVDHFLDEAAVNEVTDAAAHNRPADRTPENLRRHAAENLINRGETMPNVVLRGELRPERTANIEPTIVRSQGRRIVLATMTDDQYLMFQRKMGSYMDAVEVNLPDDHAARRTEAARVQIIRDISNLME
jgi:hypothetical protein